MAISTEADFGAQHSTCKYREKIMKDRILCPVCDKDYEIAAITHICNSSRKCGPKTTVYIERYVDKLSREERIKIARAQSLEEDLSDDILETLIDEPPQTECNNCEKIRKERNTVKKHTCPDCNYNGYYTCGDDKLCPSCKFIKENPPTVKTSNVKKQKSLSRDNIPECVIMVQRELELHLEVNNDIATITAFYPAENIFVNSLNRTYVLPDECKLISEFLNEITCDYRWYWVPRSIKDIVTLKEHYTEYSSAPLGRYARPVYTFAQL